MKTRTLLVALLCLAVYSIVRADTYVEFRTSRFYSANASYFVEVRPDRRATLYRVRPRRERVWSQVLAKLPGVVYVTNDGARVVMVEQYYGNGGEASAKVVVFFDEAGRQVADHALQDVAALKLVSYTISAAHWYRGGLFTPDQTTFIVETSVRKCEPPKLNPQTEAEIAELWECERPTPYEELRFSMANGALISRESVRERYVDREKLLLRELEFVLEKHPPDELSLAYANLQLARFYEAQKQFARATGYYDRAIPTYNKSLGGDSYTTGEAVGDAANNQRKLGNYRRADLLFRRALNGLDKHKGRPQSVNPIAIRIYEDYAAFLRERNRGKEAEMMELRARVLRSVNPDYKRD